MARNVGVLPGSSVGDPGLARGQVKGGGAGRGRGPGIPTFRAVPIPPDLVLRVFPYCIGPSELFHGLWDLELLEQVNACMHARVYEYVGEKDKRVRAKASFGGRKIHLELLLLKFYE
eukprot:scaffold11684_cov21-Tisochrysis_lutea.AAC.2